MFLTASYCQKCKRMTPQLNRIARISSEELDPSGNNDNVIFAHVDISKGPRGKQLGKILNVKKVPSVIIFENGECIKATNDDRRQAAEEEESSSPSIVIDKSNLGRLEEVAKVLSSGEKRNVNVHTLLLSSAVEKAVTDEVVEQSPV